MHQLSDENVLYAFSSDLTPVLTVESGDTVRLQTKDCFSNQIQTSDDSIENLDWDHINPATGPVYVNGAVAGGALKVTIDNIELNDQTVSSTGADAGVIGDVLTEWDTKLCKIDGDNVVWDENLNIPLAPMIGVIGVAPEGEPINCGTPGQHGGNMDNTAITTGATLYFPVACDGALFGCGDMHAAMGDGEVSVSGAEVAGYATVTLTALPELKLTHPLIENETHFGVIASADTLDAAADIAVHELVKIIHERTNMPESKIVMALSLTADVNVCQMVDPQKTVRFMVPKYVLKAWDFAL